MLNILREVSRNGKARDGLACPCICCDVWRDVISFCLYWAFFDDKESHSEKFEALWKRARRLLFSSSDWSREISFLRSDWKLGKELIVVVWFTLNAKHWFQMTVQFLRFLYKHFLDCWLLIQPQMCYRYQTLDQEIKEVDGQEGSDSFLVLVGCVSKNLFRFFEALCLANSECLFSAFRLCQGSWNHVFMKLSKFIISCSVRPSSSAFQMIILHLLTREASLSLFDLMREKPRIKYAMHKVEESEKV